MDLDLVINRLLHLTSVIIPMTDITIAAELVAKFWSQTTGTNAWPCPSFWPRPLITMVDTSESSVNTKSKIIQCLDGWLWCCSWRNERSGSYFTSSVSVLEIACYSTYTGFSWDHHGIFATLSSRLVKIPGHKYYFFANQDTSGT